MKKWAIAIAVVFVIAVGYYLISPAFTVVEKDEPIPGTDDSMMDDGMMDETTPDDSMMDDSAMDDTMMDGPSEINDRMDDMGPDEMRMFEDMVERSQIDAHEMQESMPSGTGPTAIAMGAFKPRAHEVEGSATLFDVSGQRVLRFEDFDTINGPNLHVYLSSELGDNDYVDLGELKATRGNFNYQLDPSIDTDRYNKVLVWCVPFGVLFSYAELQ